MTRESRQSRPSSSMSIAQRTPVRNSSKQSTKESQNGNHLIGTIKSDTKLKILTKPVPGLVSLEQEEVDDKQQDLATSLAKFDQEKKDLVVPVPGFREVSETIDRIPPEIAQEATEIRRSERISDKKDTVTPLKRAVSQTKTRSRSSSTEMGSTKYIVYVSEQADSGADDVARSLAKSKPRDFKLANHPREATHLIVSDSSQMPRGKIRAVIASAAARGAWIVDQAWVYRVLESHGRFPDVQPFVASKLVPGCRTMAGKDGKSQALFRGKTVSIHGKTSTPLNLFHDTLSAAGATLGSAGAFSDIRLSNSLKNDIPVAERHPWVEYHNEDWFFDSLIQGEFLKDDASESRSQDSSSSSSNQNRNKRGRSSLNSSSFRPELSATPSVNTPLSKKPMRVATSPDSSNANIKKRGRSFSQDEEPVVVLMSSQGSRTGPKSSKKLVELRRSKQEKIVFACTDSDEDWLDLLEATSQSLPGNAKVLQIRDQELKDLRKMKEVTTLIVGKDDGKKPRRTLKALAAICNGSWLVSPSYVTTSIEKGFWVSEDKFELSNRFPGALVSRRSDHKIFEGQRFYIKDVIDPSPKIIQLLLEMAGASIVMKPEESEFIISSTVEESRKKKKSGAVEITVSQLFDAIEKGYLPTPQELAQKGDGIQHSPTSNSKSKKQTRGHTPLSPTL